MEGDYLTDDWTLITPHHQDKKSDDTPSDIEVISNPSSVESEMISESQPRMLYSEMVKREKVKSAVSESDIELVPEEPLTPEMEYDDEEYINEILKSTQPAVLSSESDDSGSEIDSAGFKQLFDDTPSSDILVEVNMTLLSFSIIIGISGMSGFFLGGIYSAILTSNFNHSTDIMDVSSPAPQLQHGYYRKMNMCPNNACDKQIYRIEENMKQMKQTLSHDIKACHRKLSKTIRENAALYHTVEATGAQSEKRCAKAQANLAKLQSKTSSLISELSDQKSALEDLKVHHNKASAESTLQIVSLKAMLEESRSNLISARDAVRLLGEANFECKKDHILSGVVQDRAVIVASKKTNEALFWKNLYKHAVMDLEQADLKIGELEKSLADQIHKSKNDQVSKSNVKINYIKAKAENNHYKEQVEYYGNLLEKMGSRYNQAKAQRDSLTEEYDNLKLLNKEIESSLHTCTNTSIKFEKKALDAFKMKQYIENILISRISKDKEQYSILKDMYRNQEQVVAELSEQQSSLEDTLIRKITGNRQKFLQVKNDLEELLYTFSKKKGESQKLEDILVNKVMKSKNERLDVQDELKKSKKMISEFEEQMALVELYTKQIENLLHELNNDVVMRNTVQKKYVEQREAEWDTKYNQLKNYYENLLQSQISLSDDLSKKFNEVNNRLELTGETLSRRTNAYGDLKKRHTLTQSMLKEESDRAEFWKSSFAESQINHQKSELELNSCRNGKMTAIAEYKRTTNMLLELIQNVASKPKFPWLSNTNMSPSHSRSYALTTVSQADIWSFSYNDHIKLPFQTDLNLPFIYPQPLHRPSSNPQRLTPPTYFMSTPSRYTVSRLMKISEGQNFSILQHLYNTSTEASELDTCLAVVSPLFPGIQPKTLINVINMTQSSSKSSYKMSTALQKYWGGVGKALNKLNKKHNKADDDDDHPEHDWYMSRKPIRGEYPQGPKSHMARQNDWYMSRKGSRYNRGGKYSYSKYEHNDWYLKRKPMTGKYSYKKHGHD